MGYHVSFSQRVQLNIHVAQTLMWLLDVRSPRSDAQYCGGDRHGAFIQTRRNLMSVLSLGVNMSFTQLCLDLFFREMSPRSAYWSALMDPAGALFTL